MGLTHNIVLTVLFPFFVRIFIFFDNRKKERINTKWKKIKNSERNMDLVHVSLSSYVHLYIDKILSMSKMKCPSASMKKKKKDFRNCKKRMRWWYEYFRICKKKWNWLEFIFSLKMLNILLMLFERNETMVMNISL